VFVFKGFNVLSARSILSIGSFDDRSSFSQIGDDSVSFGDVNESQSSGNASSQSLLSFFNFKFFKFYFGKKKNLFVKVF
jgi:hypothetical protein